MNLLQALILGLVQGITEFLPVSSSAHLVLLPFLLGWKLEANQAFVFDVLVQLGTLLAVLVYFWKDLVAIFKAVIVGIKHKAPFEEAESRLGWYLVLATIPAGLVGLLLKKVVEKAFSSPLATGGFLVLTALLLVAAELWARRERELDTMKPLDALVIGLFQAASIFPGLSRSGTTISGGMFRGFKREGAARFSFLMSIPVMLAAGLMAIMDLRAMSGLAQFLPALLLGFVVSAVVGYLCIRWLLQYVKKNSFYPFAIYCTVLGLVVIVVSFLR